MCTERELLKLSSSTHWFCAKTDGQATDSRSSSAQDVTSNLRFRQDQAAHCLTLYAYDDALKYQEAYARAVDKQLERCDDCIVEYYKAKQRLLEGLRNDYEEEQVGILERAFNERDIGRIAKNLDRVERQLRGLEPPQRNKNVLDVPLQFGLFEGLCNSSFLSDDFLLSKHFEAPFGLVQTNKKLQVPRYVPAITIFLFGRHYQRRSWAMYACSKNLARVTKDDFDFAIREPLLANMQSIHPVVKNPEDLERFWSGVGLMVDSFDNDLITHSLRSMDIDLFLLALDNLRYDVSGFRFLLRTIRKLLERAPRDFWDAMGTISPTTFIEQVFNNGRYDRIMELREDVSDGEPDSSTTDDLLHWIKPFMASLESVHQVRACRSLAFQLLGRLQVDRFPQSSRAECFRYGLDVLAGTLNNLEIGGQNFVKTSRIAAAETLEVISEHVVSILRDSILAIDYTEQERLNSRCLKLVQAALIIDCKCLKTDQNNLKKEDTLPEGCYSNVSSNWDALVHQMDRGNMSLAKTALSSIIEVLGLEKFKSTAESPLPKDRTTFNLRLGRLNHLVCQILERVNDFSFEDLDKLFACKETSKGLLSTLFSPDAGLHESGVNLIKSVSSELARKEALGHLLQSSPAVTLSAFSSSARRIMFSKNYGSCPRFLKLSSDMLDILSDPSDGFLRTRVSMSQEEMQTVEDFWAVQWDVLRMIYLTTEYWSQTKVADSDTLKEFCRDTMQYSERVFNQYDVFNNAMSSTEAFKLHDIESDKSTTAGKGLLERPVATMDHLIKWLRLRDSFLLEISSKLTRKMLNRLTENKLAVSESSARFLEQVVTEELRNNLTPQMRAEIARALEANLGRPVLPAHFVDLSLDTPSDRSREQSVEFKARKYKKNQPVNLDAWMAKGDRNSEAPEIPDEEFSDSGVLDSELLSVSHSLEKMNQMKQQQKSLPSKQKVKPLEVRPQSSMQKALKKQAPPTVKSAADQASFREKREEEREAKRRRDAEALAMVKKKAGISSRTVGEGSGIGGIGIKGKDHAPKGPSIMVSSESDSDSDELDEEIFGKKVKSTKISNAVRDYEKAKMLQMQMQKRPVKKTRQVRSAKDMRARLAPNLTPLHKTILGWDFFHEGHFPPESDRKDYSLVSNKFRTPDEYSQVFRPLLVLEAWQSFLQSKDEGNFKPFEVKVASRMNVDAFVELSTTMSTPIVKDIGLGEADIILLSKAKSPANDRTQPHCLARVSKLNRKKGSTEITYRVNVTNDLLSAMAPNASLYGIKIDSITPLEREYGALLGLQYYDLCDEIIKGRPSPLLDYSDQQLGPLINAYGVNRAQAKAIKSAMDNDAFTLVQGPPGSGKTKTIVAIIGALLSGVLVEKDRGIPIARPFNGATHRSGSVTAAKKLLVCAPSNAAVDELVMRLKQGVKITNGEHRDISVVRLGRTDAINSNVLDVTLEELVNRKLNLASGKTTNTGEDIQKLMTSHKATSESLHSVREKLDALKSEGKMVPPEINRDFEVLKRKKQQLSNQIDVARDSGDIAARDAEIRRRTVQQEILNNSHVICATLSGSGHEMFQGLNVEFETVVIDEAAQSIELSALIPLKYGCSKCILVGDPKQLPPTVLSREAARFQFEQSLFVRMQANHSKDVHLLDTQYRMHPEISSFPSTAFYDSKLLDGPEMARLRMKPWHRNKILGPYRFFDVQGMHQSAPRGHSLINNAEIEIALKLYARLRKDCSSYDFHGKIGIITPYKSQLRELRARFAQRYGDDILVDIDFNTTDSFQGRESEIIIFSCVRASNNSGIGFLSDIRRMNVGITRAKASLWVLGNAKSLMQGEYWSRMIRDARARDRFTDDMSLLSPDALPLIDLSVTAEQDVIMKDADNSNSLSNPHSPVAASNDTKASGSRQNPISYHQPSGGSNGLNQNLNCYLCGSNDHLTSTCDNQEALESGFGKCYRCGEPGHTRDRCRALLCLNCSKTGHIKRQCVSEPLPKKDRAILERKEAQYQSALQRAPEANRRRQLGDHDRKVPPIKTTVSSSDSETTNSSRQSDRRDLVKGNVPHTAAPDQNRVPTGPKAVREATGQQLSIVNPDKAASNTTSRKDENPSKGSIIRQGDPNYKPSTLRAPVVNQNPVRIPKRKREADPFIRPKKK